MAVSNLSSAPGEQATAETQYQVHLINGPRVIASLPAKGEGPKSSYTVKGRTWLVVGCSACHDEGPTRYSWIVHVRRVVESTDESPT